VVEIDCLSKTFAGEALVLIIADSSWRSIRDLG
jgi:hypothetical protein